MRALIQRVHRASVTVDHTTVAEISSGLLVLIGIHSDDTGEDRNYIRKKVLGLRIFDDEKGVMNLDISQTGGEILLVSQFTLYGDARKGRRPSWSQAMSPDRSEAFFNELVSEFREEYSAVQTGRFGEHMDIDLVNNGPVTILLDSSKIL